MNLELYTWWSVLQLFFLLLVLYWALKLLMVVLERIGRKTLLNKSINSFLTNTLLVFKPIAAVLLLLDFISINYITHSIILVIIGVFGFGHIKNYINGIVLKYNPLIGKGTAVLVDAISGRIKALRPFGVVISTEKGERYMDYNTLDKLGFTIVSNIENTSRQTLYITTDKTKNQLLDLLFNNPIIDYSEEPSLENDDQEGTFKLKYTLEKGANKEDLVTFLTSQKIKSTFKKI